MNRVIDYYSDWNKLKRSVAWMTKLREGLWKLKEESEHFSKIIQKNENDPEKQKFRLQVHMEKFKSAMERKALALEDLEAAKSEIVRFTLQKGGHLSCGSQLFKLDPDLRDGMLRVGGRLNTSGLPENATQPTKSLNSS